jgi:CO/xanthine dehydrogenase FAD-binding subunit
MDSSVGSVAVVAGPRARVAVTFAGDRVIRMPGVEQMLGSAERPGRSDVYEAAATDLAGIPLRTDDRASDRYRRRVIPVLVERAVRDAFDRAASG